MPENSISVCKTLLLLLRLIQYHLRFIYQLTTIFLSNYQLTVNAIRAPSRTSKLNNKYHHQQQQQQQQQQQ